MSYEFNPDSQAFELPNPYKIENVGLLLAGGTALVCGLLAVFSLRGQITAGLSAATAAALALSVAMVLLGLGQGTQALRQLKFFFGRNRPQSLAPTYSSGQVGTSAQAESLKETLRHNAVSYEEPLGALNGLLYAWLGALVFAPTFIQQEAQRQFQNFVGLTTTLLSFLLCWVLVGSSPASGWIGVLYAVVAYYYAGPLRQWSAHMRYGDLSSGGDKGATPHAPTQDVKWEWAAMLVGAMVAPVLLTTATTHLPPLDGAAINGVVALAMVLVLVAIAVFAMALKMQLADSPQEVGASRVLDTVTMNAHPAKLVEELDRLLMDHWTSRIPNRRYACKMPNALRDTFTDTLPDTSARQSAFSVDTLEETQPVPQQANVVTDLAQALASPYFRWLTYLTLMGSACLGGGVIALALVVQGLLNGQPWGVALALALSLLAVGHFAQQASHQLWGRFGFTSQLIWVEFQGSVERAQVSIGNQFSGHLHSTKTVANIETMTLRVWAADIETVIFGKDGARELVRMRGAPTTAQTLADGLKQFGESRSMVVAPSTATDLQRLGAVAAANQIVNAGAANHFLPAAAKAAVQLTALNASVCQQCSGTLAVGASHCGNCGRWRGGDV